MIALTEKGKAVRSRILDTLDAQQFPGLQNLTAQQQTEFGTLLSKVLQPPAVL